MKKHILFILAVLVLVSCNTSDKNKSDEDTNEVVVSRYINEQPQIINSFEVIEGEKVIVYQREYYEDGSLLKEGAIKSNKRHGIWTSYYRDGKKWSEGEFVEGKMEGSTTSYHPNGELRYTGSFENGKKSGEWRFYDENGELLEIQYFQPEPIEE
jgi:antitoxin component YwqK of YwqJK toxin-antitoxin module